MLLPAERFVTSPQIICFLGVMPVTDADGISPSIVMLAPPSLAAIVNLGEGFVRLFTLLILHV
jgi:hypothetical protein